MKADTYLYCTAIALTGLLAGLFYGYSCSVNKGLGNLSDEQYLRAFQSINRAILNPVFFLSFIGSLFMLIITVIVTFRSGHTVSGYYALVSLLVYAVGVFGITLFGNVPLNEQLDKFDLSATADQIAVMRRTFEASWNRLHLIRTVAAIAAFCCLLPGLINLQHK